MNIIIYVLKGRPYACAVCNKDLSHQYDIEAHQHEHIDQCPYACDVCNKTFSQKSIMKKHQLIHSGQRPYACDVCENLTGIKTLAIMYKTDKEGNKLQV